MRAPVRLGSEVFLTGKLAPATIGQACASLRDFRAGDGRREGRRVPGDGDERGARSVERRDARGAGAARGRDRPRGHRGGGGGAPHPARRPAPPQDRRQARAPRRCRGRLDRAHARRSRRGRVLDLAAARDGARHRDLPQRERFGRSRAGEADGRADRPLARGSPPAPLPRQRPDPRRDRREHRDPSRPLPAEGGLGRRRRARSTSPPRAHSSRSSAR